MCGIIGYAGEDDTIRHLVEGLSALEYRGYDSAGVAAFNLNGDLLSVKAKGRLSNVTEKLKNNTELGASPCGIGHTRWATHGEPSDINSHPHGNRRLQLVHNGIIENYMEIKAKLEDAGYVFSSETDTEAASALMSFNYDKTGDPLQALRLTLSEIRGSYAFAILFSGDKEHVYAARNGSPLIIGVGNGENYVASDITAILRYTKNYYFLTNGEITVISKNDIKIYGNNGEPVEKKLCTANWSCEEAERGGYPHFMLKEIHEEPKALAKTLSPRINNLLPSFEGEHVDVSVFGRVKRVHIIACGTAMHAGCVAKTFLSTLAKLPAEVEIASEFRYNDPLIDKDDLVIIISQSGETADTLAGLRLAKEKGAYTLAIVNVMGSSIAREADSVLYTWAGPEIAVASTKAYTVQVALLALLSIAAGLVRKTLCESEAKRLTAVLTGDLPKAIEDVLRRGEEIKKIAKTLIKVQDMFFLGRGIDYYLSMEASLKLKEISYIHSEAYAAGELKHGTISLIEEGTPVVSAATVKRLYEKMLSNIKEVKARGAFCITFCPKDAADLLKESDIGFILPETEELFSVLPAATALQLLAYYVAADRGCDIDKPRNLAKSVTVE